MLGLKFKALIISLVMFASLLAGAVAPAQAMTNDRWENRITYQINKVKENRNLPKVRYGRCVDRRAEQWARTLDSSNAFYHQNLRILLDRCNARRAGEILARGQDSPRQMVRAWMRSPSHRDVILVGQYRRIGVAVRDTPHGKLAVVNFIRH